MCATAFTLVSYIFEIDRRRVRVLCTCVVSVHMHCRCPHYLLKVQQRSDSNNKDNRRAVVQREFRKISGTWGYFVCIYSSNANAPCVTFCVNN